jgi:hypothetical protein
MISQYVCIFMCIHVGLHASQIMLFLLTSSYVYALHWNVPGCPRCLPSTLSLPRPTLFISLRYRILLPDCLLLWEQFLCSAAVLFGFSQKFSCRLAVTKCASSSCTECQGVCLYGFAFGSMPSQNHANVLLARSQNYKKATIRFVISTRLSVHLSAWNISAPTGRILTFICLRAILSYDLAHRAVGS